MRSYAQARSACLAAWEVARQEDDYARFAPVFAHLLKLVAERASAVYAER